MGIERAYVCVCVPVFPHLAANFATCRFVSFWCLIWEALNRLMRLSSRLFEFHVSHRPQSVGRACLAVPAVVPRCSAGRDGLTHICMSVSILKKTVLHTESRLLTVPHALCTVRYSSTTTVVIP